MSTGNNSPSHSTDFKSQLISLPKTLRAVHSALIQSLKQAREISTGKPLSPVEWFNALTIGTEFLWVHLLTSVMSDIDALLDNRTEISPTDFAVVKLALQNLFDSDSHAVATSGDFKNKYFDAMAADPDLILPHATLKKMLDQLPDTSAEILEQAKRESGEIRASWHMSERRLAHLRSSERKNT